MAFVRSNWTVVGLITLTELFALTAAIEVRAAVTPACLKMRSYVYFTAAASSGSPLANLRPFRSWNVTTVRFLFYEKLWAIPPTNWLGEPYGRPPRLTTL